MIRKSGYRLSEKIMRKQNAGAFAGGLHCACASNGAA
jgi:hypothetical protein